MKKVKLCCKPINEADYNIINRKIKQKKKNNIFFSLDLSDVEEINLDRNQ